MGDIKSGRKMNFSFFACDDDDFFLLLTFALARSS